jgi:hypothetical protein
MPFGVIIHTSGTLCHHHSFFDFTFYVITQPQTPAQAHSLPPPPPPCRIHTNDPSRSTLDPHHKMGKTAFLCCHIADESSASPILLGSAYVPRRVAEIRRVVLVYSNCWSRLIPAVFASMGHCMASDSPLSNNQTLKLIRLVPVFS